MALELTDIYWIAGFLEGEGSFGGGGSKTRKSPIATATQKQREPLERLQNLLGGRITFSDHKTGIYRWYLPVVESVGLMMTIYQIMSPRRQEQIASVLKHWRGSKGRISAYNKICKRGHKVEGDNLIIDKRNSHQCRTCVKDDKRTYNAKRTKDPAIVAARTAYHKTRYANPEYRAILSAKAKIYNAQPHMVERRRLRHLAKKAAKSASSIQE